MSGTFDRRHVEAVRTLARERGADKTFCPTDAARRVDANNWRAHLGGVRDAAITLIDSDELAATQAGEPVDPRTARGPIRYRAAQPSA